MHPKQIRKAGPAPVDAWRHEQPAAFVVQSACLVLAACMLLGACTTAPDVAETGAGAQVSDAAADALLPTDTPGDLGPAADGITTDSSAADSGSPLLCASAADCPLPGAC